MPGSLNGRDFRIGNWVIHPTANEVRNASTTVHLEPKVMEVLVYLAEHAEEVVSREELIETIWPGTYVTDQVLTRAMCELRHTFDAHEDAPIIQTIAKRGYRLLTSVTCDGDSTERSRLAIPAQTQDITQDRETPQDTSEHQGFIRKRLLIAFVLVVLAIATASGWWWFRARSATSKPLIVAVLPISDLSGDSSQANFCDTLTDEIITELGAEHDGFEVLDRAAVVRYRNSDKSDDKIGRELHVPYVVRSTVHKDGRRIRISVHIVMTSGQAQIWARMYEQDVRDIVALEPELVRTIAFDVRQQLEAHATSHVKTVR